MSWCSRTARSLSPTTWRGPSTGFRTRHRHTENPETPVSPPALQICPDGRILNKPSGEESVLNQEYRRFLIVRTDRIGDVILTLPMARALKLRRPDAHVAVLIRSYTAELARADRNVDEIIALDGGRPSWTGTIARLREAQFDVVFHTHPMARLAFIALLAGIPVRVGTGFRWYSFLFNRRVYEHRKDAARHELEYNLNLLGAV